MALFRRSPATSTTSDALGDVTGDSGGFQCGDMVAADRFLRVRGIVVVRRGGRGHVIGPANSPGRVCVQFDQREDFSENRLNCLPDELRHELVGGHQVGSHVRASRALEDPSGRAIVPGSPGVVIGPARNVPHGIRRLLVRFAAAGGEEPPEEVTCGPEDVETAIAGNFRRGNAVIATRDLRVGGTVVVREGVIGTVVGPSSSDSQNRVTVCFSHREDGSRNRLNCVVHEIHLYLPGGHEVGARVHVLRSVTYDAWPPVLQGARGVVVGPAVEEPLQRLLVRLDNPPVGGGSAERELRADDVALVIAGGFRCGESVAAAKDLRVKGHVVVKQGVVGTVVGQSATDPAGRVTVFFARREDGRCNNLNVVPMEIQRMPCTGGLVQGDRVAALRQLLVVPRGTHGTVVGPSCARSTRVAVRFSTANVDGGEDVVLHVEPEDLRVLHAVGEDVDDSGVDPPEGEDMTEDGGRQAVAGGYDRGDTVAATRDLCVAGKVVVRANVLGTVIGPSGQDPDGRVTVAFAWREDGKTNNLNVMTGEIRGVEPRQVARGELCAICLGELLSESEDICRMPCGHVLHAVCARAYLNHQTGTGSRCQTSSPNHPAAATVNEPLAPMKPAQCPVCRRDMLP